MDNAPHHRPEVDWHKWIMDHGEVVRAFEPAPFAADDDAARLAAGALIMQGPGKVVR